MKIGVKNKNDQLSLELRNLGYTITNLNNKGIDVMLYDSSISGEFMKAISENSLTSMGGDGIKGALLIDVKGKNAKDIHEVIMRRLYTPLF